MAIALEEIIVAALPEILSALQNAATSSQLNAIEQDINNLTTYVGQVQTFLNNQIIAVYNKLLEVQFAVNDLSQQPPPQLQLPPTPPPGYGGASASDVWNTPTGLGSETMGTLQQRSGVFALRVGEDSGVAFPSRSNPLFLLREFWDSYVNHSTSDAEFFLRDFHTDHMLDYPTLLAFLNAYKGTDWSVSLDASGYYLLLYLPDLSADIQVLTSINEAQFAAIKAAAGAATPTAPVWPGLAGVTLGTPVAVSPSFTVTTPMQGILMNLSAVGIKKTTFNISGEISHRGIGSLVFVDDHGEAEDFQPVHFENQIYVPKAMAEAASCHFNLDVDNVGTVTPFTIP
jgi:hypothetical protein